MTKTVELDVAQSRLKEIIAELGPDDEVLIVRDQQPIAKLSSPSLRMPRVPGLMKGKLTVLAEDNEHLEDFKDYMP